MKCPNCEYEHGTIWKEEGYVKVGDEKFYQLPIKMERGTGWDEETVSVFACPKCKIVFIEEYF